MALLTPERVPVKMYKWDDDGAPVLKKTTNSLMSIFEACLVTGYGTKTAAGWTKPYEASGIKVFRPQVGAEIDFYLQCSANATTQMTAKVYTNMTNASVGDLKLQCAQPFKYARGTITGKWLLVASPRGLWFFCEQGFQLNTPELLSNSGAYFFVGDTARDAKGLRAVYIQHTGGTYTDGDYSDMFGFVQGSGVITKPAERYVYGALLDNAGVVHTCDTESYFNGRTVRTADRVLSPLLIFINQQMYQLPGLTVPSDGVAKINFDTQAIAMNGYVSNIINFGGGPTLATNFCLSADIWSY